MSSDGAAPDAAGETYNILSLDGGGTWAVLQAMALADLYGADTPGHEILSHYNLVVANSGGSLVAAGLWANMQPRQLVQEFTSGGILQKVFSRLPWYRRLPRSIFRSLRIGPQYSTLRKLDAITALMDSYSPGLSLQPIQALPRQFGRGSGRATDLLLLAYDYDTNRAKFLRTNPDSKAGARRERAKQAMEAGRSPAEKFVPKYKTTLAEAVHASTNAPVNYFDAPAEISYSVATIRTWDGAIAGHNNPVLAGITEALANDAPRKRIRILSIGTGGKVLPAPGDFGTAHKWLVAGREPPKWWITGDLYKLSTCILENPPDVATYVGWFMIDDQRDVEGEPDDSERRRSTRIVRLSPLRQPIVHPGTHKFDVPGWHSPHPDRLSPKEFERLLDMDLDATAAPDVDLITRFGQLWLDEWVHNQPILAGQTRIECEIGQRWYSQARTRARELGLVPQPRPERLAEETARVAAKTALEEELKRQHEGKAATSGPKGQPHRAA